MRKKCTALNIGALQLWNNALFKNQQPAPYWTKHQVQTADLSQLNWAKQSRRRGVLSMLLWGHKWSFTLESVFMQ